VATPYALGNAKLSSKINTGGNSVKPSRLMLAAACIVMLPATGHAAAAGSAYEVMKGCRAFIVE